MSDKKTGQIEASFRAYQLGLDLLDKYVNLPIASNTHYKNEAIYRDLLYLSLNNTYAETAMAELKDEHRIDAPTGTQFLNRVKKLFGIPSSRQEQQKLDFFQRSAMQMKIRQKLTLVNDELVSTAVTSGLFKKPVICAIDYTKIAYYGAFNSNIVRSKHDKGQSCFTNTPRQA